MESKGGKKTTLMVLSAVVTLTKDLIHWYKFKAILFVCRGRCLHLIWNWEYDSIHTIDWLTDIHTIWYSGHPCRKRLLQPVRTCQWNSHKIITICEAKGVLSKLDVSQVSTKWCKQLPTGANTTVGIWWSCKYSRGFPTQDSLFGSSLQCMCACVCVRV